MKIAFINKYQNYVNRGAETYVKELAKRLSKRHQVDILTKVNFLKKYDIVIPTNGRFQVFVVRLLTLLTGSKMIVSGQSGIGFDDRLNLYAFPDAFVALSTKALNWSKKLNPFVRSVYIPNGVSYKEFSSQTSSLETGLKKPIILCVSALTKNKRLDLVISAVSKTKKGSLILVGKGPEEENLKKQGDSLLPNRLKIMSFNHSEMPRVFNSADVFTFPTVPWESFGIVLVEAMASGLPVVATDDPIRREIVGDAGLFVNPNNIDEYTKAIEKALNRKWGDKPKKQAMKFDWDKIAMEYDKLISSI